MESQISAKQGELSEAVENAQEVASYEPEENETVTATSMKKVLKALMEDLKEVEGASAKREYDQYKAQDDAIKKIEKRVSALRKDLKEKQTELDVKLRLKRVGGEAYKAETKKLIQQVEEKLANLDPNKKEEKKEFNANKKDKEALEARLTRIDGILEEIGGQLTAEETKTLILKKLYNWAKEHLTRYLNQAKRTFIAQVERLWDKYAVSSRVLEEQREETLTTLNQYLDQLGYWK